MSLPSTLLSNPPPAATITIDTVDTVEFIDTIVTITVIIIVTITIITINITPPPPPPPPAPPPGPPQNPIPQLRQTCHGPCVLPPRPLPSTLDTTRCLGQDTPLI